jgi:Flp pilus assembly protein TadG
MEWHLRSNRSLPPLATPKAWGSSRPLRVFRPGRAPTRGQALVEFAMVVPVFLLMLVAVIEFSLALNAVLSVNFASREAALIAAEAGNADGADCAILAKVEEAITAPTDEGQITEVRIFKSNRVGQALATNRYTRGGSMTCPLGTGSVTVPYTLAGTEAYQDTKRCNILLGCPANPPLPATTSVDHIGVEIRYSYLWHTPLRAFLDLQGTGYSIVQSNAMRMEPVL